MDSVRFVRLALLLCAIWDPRRIQTKETVQRKLNKIDLHIIKDRTGQNTVASSFAFRLPLCKLAAAASTTTRHEIISVLDIHTLSETKTCYSSLFPALSPLLQMDLTILNKIYLNYTDEVDDHFILDSQAYGLTVSKIGYDFRQDAVAYVNREFSSKTYMRIRDVLDISDINEHSSILLVNGFHYKATWETTFDEKSTQIRQFRSGNETLKMEMMRAVTQCLFLNDEGEQYKAISMRLSQGGMHMTFVLPYRNSSIVNLLYTMVRKPDFLDNLNKEMQWKFVKVLLPKFKIKTNLDWTPYLKRVGLNLTMNMNNTGLKGILKDEDSKTNMYISKAKQKIFLEVDEGPARNKFVGQQEIPQVRAEMERSLPEAPPIPIEDFTVDGPYFFSVTMTTPAAKRKSHHRLFQVFNGVYYGPEK